MERVILEIFHPYSSATERIVVSSGRVLIGRGYHCDVILDDPYVSGEHVEVVLYEEGYFLLADKGSVNGVFIGTHKISDMQARLDSGQEIKIGKTRIKIFAPRHAIAPVQSHNLLSSILHVCDRPVTGILVSVVAAVLIICVNARVESADVDFWKKEALGIGMGFFLFISIVWSAIHMSLVIKNKKFMPWPRIISYLSVTTFVIFIFWMLILPYFEFYLLSPAPTLIFTAVLLFLCLSLYEYFYYIVCELPRRSARSTLNLAMVVIVFTALVNIDVEYDSDPVFPEIIVTADLPLPQVRPLDAFIEQAFAKRLK